MFRFFPIAGYLTPNAKGAVGESVRPMLHDGGEGWSFIVPDIPERGAGYRPLVLETDRGKVACRYYAAQGASKGVVWVGGTGGGWDTPARGLYPDLAKALMEDGISSLRVRFRMSTRLRECVSDVQAGLLYMANEGISIVGLVGHSFGGAVVIRTAASSSMARTVVALAPSSSGSVHPSELGPHCSLLLAHGTADDVVPSSCSESIHHLAGEPKELALFPGAGHSLDEAAAEVRELVRTWLRTRLAPGQGQLLGCVE
ncbi:MAG TPA: dienelactone hydrolase family protein [Actinomycetota bacterium]|nr:dienelactone hydrolase family protein [Actinomycetota bacterium]